MAGSVNKVILIGRLGKDPELKYLPNGTPMAKFSLATDSSYKDANGEKKERTEWHNIVAWSKLAEICSQYLTKGKQVYIEGSIQSQQWEDKQTGAKRTKYEIIARNMTMLGSRADTERPSGGAGQSAHPRSEPEEPLPPEPPSGAGPDITDEDIPF
jgi:single-strand DNA-binding protein